MRVAITGSSGLIGSDLASFLRDDGHDTFVLVRRPPCDQSEIQWDPLAGQVDRKALEDIEAVVHLAGENIASGRWTAARKRAIRDSRVEGTRLLCETLASLDRKPRVLIAASAIGYYGNRGDEAMTEDSRAGTGFLADVTQAWEAASLPASQAGIRTVNLRIGVVLSTKGGALARMLTPFRLGMGGVLGSGRQYMSWIALEDIVRAIRHCLDDASELSGPVNGVAPGTVTNREFTTALGRLLRRPTLFPVPAMIIKLAFAEMGEELLLASTRVEPVRLQSSGFRFAYPDLDSALRAALGETR